MWLFCLNDFGKFLAIIFSHAVSATFSLSSPSPTHSYTYVRLLDIVPLLLDVLFLFFFFSFSSAFFSLCGSVWVTPITISSCSLILSSAVSVLLRASGSHFLLEHACYSIRY